MKEKLKAVKKGIVWFFDILTGGDGEEKEVCKHHSACFFHRCDMCRRNPNFPDYLMATNQMREKRRENNKEKSDV